MTLRMHSMRKRRVTTKFTMLKKSKYSGDASWYYKIHPTHRHNTTQILYSVVCVLHITFIFPHSLTIISKSLSIRSLSLRLFRVRIEHHYSHRGNFFSCKIKWSSLTKIYSTQKDKLPDCSICLCLLNYFIKWLHCLRITIIYSKIIYSTIIYSKTNYLNAIRYFIIFVVSRNM